jgi:hypothetical protein
MLAELFFLLSNKTPTPSLPSLLLPSLNLPATTAKTQDSSGYTQVSWARTPDWTDCTRARKGSSWGLMENKQGRKESTQGRRESRPGWRESRRGRRGSRRATKGCSSVGVRRKGGKGRIRPLFQKLPREASCHSTPTTHFLFSPVSFPKQSNVPAN